MLSRLAILAVMLANLLPLLTCSGSAAKQCAVPAAVAPCCGGSSAGSCCEPAGDDAASLDNCARPAADGSTDVSARAGCTMPDDLCRALCTLMCRAERLALVDVRADRDRLMLPELAAESAVFASSGGNLPASLRAERAPASGTTRERLARICVLTI